MLIFLWTILDNIESILDTPAAIKIVKSIN